MGETPLQSFYVDSTRLRQRFGELNLLERLRQGQLRPVVAREWPAPEASGQPAGTLSQRVLYFEGELLVAIVHQYLLPDGSIGASGLPDPKWLRDGETILKFQPTSKR
jgi:hypothetical protein